MDDVFKKREKKQKQVLEMLLQNSNREFTAIEINEAVNTADARKIISNLRNKGWRIESRVINDSGTKKYRLIMPENTPKQLQLF